MYKTVIGLLALGICSAGCQTTTHHSNTMFFGTSTSLGVKVGVATSASPTVNVGYDRNEALILPLLANKKFDGNNLPEPCNQADVEECMFIGTQGKNKDTYAVLATFGADISGRANSGAEAAVGISQYFSSGHAAIELAKNGGAAAVSTGPAAKASAEQSALEQYVQSAPILEAAKVEVKEREKAHSELIELIDKTASDALVSQKMKSVDAAIFAEENTLEKECPSKTACGNHLGQNKMKYTSIIKDILEIYKK